MVGGFHGVLLLSAKHTRFLFDGKLLMNGDSAKHSKGPIIPFGAKVEYHTYLCERPI